jgi:uncharacterized phage protein (TIGR01671 family)
MREIKFRAWDKTNKKMVYGNIGFIQYENDFTVGAFDSFGYPIQNKNVELMQYTGLKDKNGKEIYEGDIVRWFFMEERVSPIEYHKWFFQPKGWGNIDLSETEVIGNIYENPELLEAK